MEREVELLIFKLFYTSGNIENGSYSQILSHKLINYLFGVRNTRALVNCLPTVDRQVTDSLPTANQQVKKKEKLW